MTLKYTEEYGLLTLDIKGLCFNVPVNAVIRITHSFLPYNKTDETLQQMLHTLHQNCFQYNNEFYKPFTVLAMESSISNLVADKKSNDSCSSFKKYET
jgi:hypothetical protein